MKDYIESYCKSHGITFGSIKDHHNCSDSVQPNLLMCIPEHVTDIMSVIEVVLQDEDLSKILISLDGRLKIWRLK